LPRRPRLIARLIPALARSSVVAVHCAPKHVFSKQTTGEITLIEGLGVAGDAHFGATVQHRSRVVRDPTQPNLRQVHLIDARLFGELKRKGYDIKPGDLGENITTRGVDLLKLPAGTQLAIGEAVIELTGLRNPCRQLDDFRPKLMTAVLERDAFGRLVRKAGVMGVVVAGGVVQPGARIQVKKPRGARRALQPV
jgi:hypothetical protein